MYLYCLQGIRSLNVLENYTEVGLEINGGQNITMLEKSSSVKFNNYSRQIKAPFVIYPDFKSIIVKNQ